MPQPTCDLPQRKGKLKRGKKSKERTEKEGVKTTGKKRAGPLQRFFTQHRGFEYNPHEPASTQFDRLMKAQGWNKDNPKHVEAWEKYLTALVKEFNVSYGRDVEDLAVWHGLLARIGLMDLPDNVKKCKKVNGRVLA